MNDTKFTIRDRDLIKKYNNLIYSKRIFDDSYVEFVAGLGKAQEDEIHLGLGYGSFAEYANDRFSGSDIGSSAVREALRTWRGASKSHGSKTKKVLAEQLKAGGNRKSVLCQVSVYDTAGQEKKVKQLVAEARTIKDLSRSLKKTFDKINPRRGFKNRTVLRGGSLDVKYSPEEKKIVVDAITLASMRAGSDENYWGMTPENRGRFLAVICGQFLGKN